MDKIFEMLGIEKLDESKQNELKETLQTVIELKAQDIAESKVEDLVKSKKQDLVEEYENKFNTYKDSVTSKFSNFVDNILDEEMVIPENIVKYARLGELYQDLIEQFKTRLAIDEGMITDEVNEILIEAKDEISTLRTKVDENTGQILELEQDASEMAAQLYIRKKCDGLTESQKKKVIDLLGDELIKENIDKKFKTITESLSILSEEDDKTSNFECSECGNKETIKEGGDTKCPECGATMKKVEEDDTDDDDDGNDDEDINESSKRIVNESSPKLQDIWLNSLKTEK